MLRKSSINLHRGPLRLKTQLSLHRMSFHKTSKELLGEEQLWGNLKVEQLPELT